MNRSHGSTLVEMLVTTVIMSILALAFMAILLVNFHTNAKIDNMQDTLNAIRTIKEKIGKDVREGRTLGDVYGTDQWDPYSQSYYTVGTASFPSTNDPIYGGSTPPTAPSGWPAVSTSSPYTLSNTCLIVQVPVLDNHNDNGSQHQRNTSAVGWPTQISPNLTTTGTAEDNVETHVYRIVPDSANPGEWQMQFASFAGGDSSWSNATGYNMNAHTYGPVTMLTGIVGPLDSSGNPKIFQFVKSYGTGAGTASDTIQPDGTHVSEYTGVVVNLEVRRHQDMTTQRKDISLTPVAVKMEVFLRNNALATSTGQPSSLSGSSNY